MCTFIHIWLGDGVNLKANIIFNTPKELIMAILDDKDEERK